MVHTSPHRRSTTHILGSYQSIPPRFVQTPSDTCTKKNQLMILFSKKFPSLSKCFLKKNLKI